MPWREWSPMDEKVRFIETFHSRVFDFTQLWAFFHVWWIKIGVPPELILPVDRQQNRRHERFHKMLKDATARPPASSLRAQQPTSDRFLQEYNHHRPHESLGQEMPASLYRPSSRPYQLEHAAHFEQRLVSRNGGIRWGSDWVDVAHVLAEEYVGLEQVDDGVWVVFFGPLLLGRLDEETLQLRGVRPTTGGYDCCLSAWTFCYLLARLLTLNGFCGSFARN